jgi:hypothetical protein
VVGKGGGEFRGHGAVVWGVVVEEGVGGGGFSSFAREQLSTFSGLILVILPRVN